ncbi:MAG: hypothetical protein JWQ32_2053 [Marmoricola sp.]|nr:hypothetical protein [Marmoricola sp.]
MTAQPTRNRYDDDDDAMFDAPTNPGTRRAKPKHWWTGRDATETRKTVLCPGHQHDAGLVTVQGEDGLVHLGFRLHQIVTAAGWRIPCGMSLKFACQVVIPNRLDVVCPHVIAERRAVASWNAEAASS